VTAHSTVRFLFISDLHGASKTKSILDPWWEDRIRSVAGSSGFDAVICSGDVGDNGSIESLRSGFQYLKVLCGLAGETARGHHVPLIVTPGNQDVDRSKIDVTDRRAPQARFGRFLRAMRESGISCIAPSLTSSRGRHIFVPQGAGIAVVPICTTWVSGNLPPEYQRKLDRDLRGVETGLKERFMNVLNYLLKPPPLAV